MSTCVCVCSCALGVHVEVRGQFARVATTCRCVPMFLFMQGHEGRGAVSMCVLERQTLVLIRGQLGDYYSGAIHLVFWSRVSHWNLKLTEEARPASKPKGLSCLYLHSAGVIMFTTVFGFKFFSLGYIYLFILARAHTQVHRPLPRHRGQRTTCSNQSPPSIVCTLGFRLMLPSFTQRCLTSLASVYGAEGIGLRPSCLCGKRFLTMLSL